MIQNKEKWLQLLKRFALPLALGIVTIVGVHHYLNRRMQAIDEQSRQDMVTRVVAVSDLPAGTILTFDQLSARDIPQAWASTDTYEVGQAEMLEGMLLLQDVIAGQPLTRSILTNPKPPALSEQLAPGRRAVTIPVDHVSSLSGRLETGDLIDLYVTFTHQGQRVTTLLVTSVRVLATDKPLVDSPYETDGQRVTSVTLDVSATQAVKLVSANQGGVLTAVLRLDHEPDLSKGKAREFDAQQANHLAGFVGLAPSLGTEAAPLIIYGDIGSAVEQLP